MKCEDTVRITVSPFERAVAGVALGAEGFVARIRDMLKAEWQDSERPSLRELRRLGRARPEAIEAMVEEIFRGGRKRTPYAGVTDVCVAGTFGIKGERRGAAMRKGSIGSVDGHAKNRGLGITRFGSGAETPYISRIVGEGRTDA